MSITNGYATVTEFQNLTGRTENASDSQLSQIEIAIESASRYIDQQTDTFFYSTTVTDSIVDIYEPNEDDIYISDDRLSIYTPAPVISVSSITEDDVSLDENDDFYIYKKYGRIDREGRWSTDRRAVKITATIGYSSTPDHIRTLCIQIASIISGLDIQTVVGYDGEEQAIMSKSIPQWVQDSLKKERFRVI